MEFLSYSDVQARFENLLIREKAEGERLRLALRSQDTDTPRVVFGSLAEDDGAEDPGSSLQHLEREKGAIVDTVDGVLHRLHMTEVGVLPTGTWRPVLDLAAFDLASDERWAEVEAEAAMHMNGRDVLAVRSDAYPVLKKVLDAVMEHGESRDHDLTMISFDTPFVMELRHDGGLTVWCANASIADEVMQVTGAPDV